MSTNKSKTPETPKPKTGGADIPQRDGAEQRAPIVGVPTKSKRKISYKEFIAGKGFNRTFLAGFKMYLNGTQYLTEDEWEKVLKQYNTR